MASVPCPSLPPTPRITGYLQATAGLLAVFTLKWQPFAPWIFFQTPILSPKPLWNILSFSLCCQGCWGAGEGAPDAVLCPLPQEAGKSVRAPRRGTRLLGGWLGPHETCPITPWGKPGPHSFNVSTHHDFPLCSVPMLDCLSLQKLNRNAHHPSLWVFHRGF